MIADAFWALVDRSARETRTRQERLDWLQDHLSRLPAEEIADYQTWFTIAANRACTWDMYAVFQLVTGYVSADGFEYFVSWLVSLGRDAYEKVVSCPDRIVELPEVRRLFELSRTFKHRRLTTSGRVPLLRHTETRRQVLTSEEFPEFGSFAIVAQDPYQQTMGDEEAYVGDAVQARGVESMFPFLTPVPETGDEWDLGDRAELVRRLPRLTACQGITEEEPDEPPSRYDSWWPGSATFCDLVRAWVFERKDGAVVASRDIRHLQCFIGQEGICSWPSPAECHCAHPSWATS